MNYMTHMGWTTNNTYANRHTYESKLLDDFTPRSEETDLSKPTARTLVRQASTGSADGKTEKQVPSGSYKGSSVDGKPHGKGVFTWDDGMRLKGKFKHGKAEGRGVLTQEGSRDRYEGNFSAGKPNGRGKVTTSESTFKGNFIDGKANGRGVLRKPLEKMICNYVDGKAQGRATQKIAGSTYHPFYQDGKFLHFSC